MKKKCFTCKEEFDLSELFNFHNHNYCRNCYEERIWRDKFFQCVCRIFRLKTPGPRIWKERKHLMDEYGYTDKTIIQTLEYLYDIKQYRWESESIYRVTPKTIEEMKQYWRDKESEKKKHFNAVNNVVTQTIYVPAVKSKKTTEEVNWDKILDEEEW